MKVVILAGGMGTRLSEETTSIPKPMISIGGKPILWHIMKIYSHYGFNDFVICLGYKGYVIKEYFSNYFLHQSDVTFDLMKNEMTVHKHRAENWKVTLIDTGELTMTGGRLKRIKSYVEGDDFFCCTYGDGVGDINIASLIEFHQSHGKDATLTSTFPPGRFGALNIEGNQIKNFEEKPKGDGVYVNGGFFVLSPRTLDRIQDDNTVWEQSPLEGLAQDGQLISYRHNGFWQPMDTLRDKNHLEDLWNNSNAPWKVW